MKRTGRTPTTLTALTLGAALLSLTVAACGAGSGGSSPPASAHTAAEQAATMHWLSETNQMWTDDDFAALDQVTTAGMRTIYLAEKRQASPPSNASRVGFQLTGLSITVPCHTGASTVFVAYGDTDVFDLGSAMQPMAMVFERTGGQWKLAAAVQRPDQGWPALCTRGTPPTAPAALAPGDYAAELARVLTHAMTGVTETAAAASPFAVNGFLAGSGSINAQSARQISQDRRAGVAFTGRFTQTPELHARAAAGRRPRLLGDRHADPERLLPLGHRAAREELAGRQPGRHPQARGRAPGDGHLHHHLHGDRPAAPGRQPSRSRGRRRGGP